MKCIISHPNIAPYIKESILAYQEHGMLDKFYTTYFEHPQYPFTKNLIRLFPKFEKEFKRRNIAEVEYRFLKGHPFFEMLRIFSARTLNTWIENRVWERSEHDFDRWVAANLSNEINWVHTYEHASLATLIKAKKLGILSFYEQPSQHHAFMNKVVHQQLKLYPSLMCESTRLIIDQNGKRTDLRKDRELAIADHVICNSTFTLKTLAQAGISDKKVIKIPYGFSETGVRSSEIRNKKFTFLFAGNQCLRKGTHILFEAWKNCNLPSEQAELVLIGKNQLSEELRQGLPSSVKFIQNIPHNELMEFYNQSDVVVFPTLADGFGMVISEAMSKGIPVITTWNSGGPDVITHQSDGWLIDAGDVKALAEQMKWCFTYQDATRQAGRRAMETAARYPWKMYRKNLVNAVKERIEENCALI
jgi:glycosyltransferase involved in cell wall biosynthesis